MSTNIVEEYENHTLMRIDEYTNRGILKKEIRSYEVSLWTLQDDFITVLKWSDAEQKGRIENPKMTLNIDGTEKFTFSIPMYYRLNGLLIENPNWYSVGNKALLTGLNKLKVIFNKGAENEAVFEFVIMDVTESHEKDILTCEVSAEGLAFLELGKIGYKYSLSLELYETHRKEWEETGSWTNRKNLSINSEPYFTLSYWCEEGLGLEKYPSSAVNRNSHTWYYDIRMNWNSFAVGDIARDSHEVYEEPYTSSWTVNLLPNTIENYRKKERIVEAEKSNIYNITLSIAEKFGVFCRYEYKHDENYHIIERIIVFYNNFLLEENGTISFTYPYSSSKISRTMESNNVTTKLFVLDVENDSTLDGINSIMNASPNASREDYILNFDYMLKIGAITQELYDAILPYEKKMREYNGTIIDLSAQLNAYLILIPEVKAEKVVAELAITLAEETINQTLLLLNSESIVDDLDDDGLLERSVNNPDLLYIYTDKQNRRYLNLTRTVKGIQGNSIKIYKDSSLTLLITKFLIIYDEYNNITTIYINENIDNQLTRVYLTYKWNPVLYYQNVINIWQINLNKNLKIVDEKTELLEQLELKVTEAESNIQTAKLDKEAEILKFERLMGPALREGYWQPEDYSDYGDHLSHVGPLTMNSINTNTGNSALIAWDGTAFDDEEIAYYESGVNLDKIYYPCINLNSVFPSGIPSDLKDYSIVWKVNTLSKTIALCQASELRVFSVGSLALIRFIKSGTAAIPVLLLIGAKTLSDTDITHMKDTAATGGRVLLEKYSTIVENNTVTPHHESVHAITSSLWVSMSSSTLIIYPRIKFSSLELKLGTEDLVIKYNNTLLLLGFDYFINTRHNNVYLMETYIRIKPELLIQLGLDHNFEVHYVLSNANTAMYLDSLLVSSENALPKVSYNVDINILDTLLTNILYNQLAQIVMINDSDLKFENVFGYISLIDLDLDLPKNDKIEVKNYKTKFEDLFSTIVALTEEMKRAGAGFNAAASGNVSLSLEGLLSTIELHPSILEEYLNSYFDSSDVVKDKLTSLFTEAGEILSDSNKALNSVRALSVENAAILSGYADMIKDLAVTIHRGDKPVVYKVGDIWIDDNGHRYVATASDEEGGDGTYGFTRVYDGTLSLIKGAGMDYNAATGLVDIYGEHLINLRSGQNISIAANDSVDIVGNKSVNIGGTTINIAAATTNGTVGGINIVATAYNESDMSMALKSKVLIKPNKITMAGSIIDMYTGVSSNSVSALKLDGANGIYIGSSNKISLYSGDGYSSANAELSPTRILFGVSNSTGSTTAVEITDAYAIFSAGNTINNLRSTADITLTNSITGVKITNTKIAMAAGSGNGRSVFTLSDGEMYLGATADPVTNGSYIKLANTGIELGSFADLYINTDNFKLLTHSRDTTNTNSEFKDGYTVLAVGSNLLKVGYSTVYDASSGKFKNGNTTLTGANAPIVNLLLNSNGLYIKGTVYADAGSFNGEVYASTFIANGPNSTKLKADSSSLGFYNGNTAVFYLDNGILNVANNYSINIDGALNINSDNFKINSNAINNTPMLYVANNKAWSSASAGLLYTPDNGLQVKGNIIANTFEGNTASSLYFVVDPSNLGFYDGNKSGLLTISTSTSGSVINLDAADGRITLCPYRYYGEKSTLPAITTSSGYRKGDLIYCIGDNKLYEVLSGTWVAVVSGAITSEEVINYILEKIAKNSFSVTDDGLLICDRIICRNGIYGNISGSAGQGISLLTECTCGSGCASSCSGACKGSCSGSCGSGCSGDCGSNCGTSCTGTCYGNCDGCSGTCWAVCASTTEGNVSGCTGNCTAECESDCTTSCTGGCTSTCTGTCENGCYSTCQGTCQNGCGLDCTVECGDTCYAVCEVGCKNSCYTWCVNECRGTCSGGCLGTAKGSTGCFIAGTLINLPNNLTIPIEKLKVGMVVISYNEYTHLIEENTVTATAVYKHKNQIYDINLSNNKIITLTCGHPLLTLNGWKAIDPLTSMKEHSLIVTLLKINDSLITINNEEVYVENIKYRDDLLDETVYICRTDPTHTFAVENVVVHNAKDLTAQ